MDKKYFDENVIMAVEVEYEGGGRCWHTMKGSEVKRYLDRLEHDEERYLSDIDYCSKQDDPEIGKIIDAAIKIWTNREKVDTGFKSLDEVINSLLTEKPAPAKRIWTEEEIKNLVQTNDKVLYGALKKLYAEQTADEQRAECTRERNGAGFNSIDAKFLSSVAQFLIRAGFLTEKQKAATRRKLVKYNKQLTRLANA